MSVDKSKTELLPCPFCGKEAVYITGGGSPEVWASCDSEDCDVCPHVAAATMDAARTMWNRRSPPTAEGLWSVSAVNKVLREQADHMRANAAKLKPMDPQEARARELAALYVEEIAIANDIDERLQRGTARVAATDIDAVLATVRKYAIPGHSVVMPIINSILKEIDAMRSPSVVGEHGPKESR